MRKVARNHVISMATLFTLIMVTSAEFVSKEPESFPARLKIAKEILDEAPVIDGHIDLPMNMRTVLKNNIEDFPFDQNLMEIEPWASRSNSDVDLVRIREGRLGGAFWSTYVPCSSQYKNALTQALEQIDVTKRLVEKYPDDLQFVTSSAGIKDAFAKGKVASMIGVEGGHMIDSSLGALRVLYEAGARYLTLTHMCNTPWADSSTAESNDEIEFDGLTAWGEEVILELNRLGVLVDISHVASQTMQDVLEISRAPVIFSHSNARELCNTTRNVPDDIIKQLNEKDGIIMVNFLSYFVSCKKDSTVQQLIDHINHIRDLTSVDHVGIGSDFEGIDDSPDGIEDVSKYPILFAELLINGWDEESLKKLSSQNLIRIFEKVEKVRDDLKREEAHTEFIPPKNLDGHDQCTNFWPS